MFHLIDRRSLLTIACVSWLAFSVLPAQAGAGADLIFTNGHVYTADPKSPWAEAVAVKGGKIVYVGSSAGAKAKRGRDTKEIDLGGRLLLPGFIDTHDHMGDRAWQLFWVNLGSALSPHTLEGYRQSILEYRVRNPGLKQVRGKGVDPWILPAIAQSRKRQPRQLLDDIVSDVPAVFMSWTGHGLWVNSKALEMAGITKETPNPPGEGDIRHDPVTGEPNGILDGPAAIALIDKLPEPDLTAEQYRAGVLSWQRDVAAPRGLTGALVPAHAKTPNLYPAMQQLSDDGLLTARYGVAQLADDLRGVEQLPEFVATRARIPGGRYFKLNTIKIFAPWPQDKLNQEIAALDKERFQVFVHVGPRESYAAVLDAFEYALKQNGSRDSRHIITHVRAEAAPLAERFKSLGVRADSDLHPAPKSYYDVGVPTTLSSDYSARDPSPLAKIAEGVKSGIPLEALIGSATIRGAQALFAEKETGSIKPGKAADLIVLDRDLFKVAPDDIAGAKVLLTLFAGKEVYRDPSL